MGTPEPERILALLGFFFPAASPFRFFLSQTFLFLTVIDNTRLVYITTFVKEKIKYFHHIYSSFLLR